MQSRLNIRLVEQASPVTVSAVSHVAVALAVLLAIYVDPVTEIVSFDVVEMPKQPILPLRKVEVPPKPTESQKAKPRGVFGISRKSITAAPNDTDSSAAKLGNTIAKEVDQKQLSENDPDALPIPTEEYLVSSMPQVLNEFRVPYPPEARKRGVQGAVVMDLLIDAAGVVREAIFVEGPGFGLNEAALEAVRRFRFRPATVEEKPVAVRIRYAYRFILE